MGFAQHRPCRNFIVACRVGRGCPTHHSWGPFEPFWGHVEGLTLETLSPVASEVASVPAKHFFSETLLLPSTGIAKMPPERICWPILGLCWPICGVYVGAMFAHLGGMLRLCCHILASCWTMLWAMLDRRGPPEVILGYVVFMTSPSFPKFCLKKLSPVACKAPTSFLQHHFSEKAESCWGRAHPWWAPEGSHQWPARFQETLPEGRKRGSAAPGGCPGSWSYDSGYHIASAARHGRI